jgi:hypothetical protein
MKKSSQFLFENQQCHESNEQEMPQLETNIHISPTILKDILCLSHPLETS